MQTMMTSAQVRQACGGVSDMTVWRWLKDADFPQPTRVNRRRYWPADAVAAWWKSHNGAPA